MIGKQIKGRGFRGCLNYLFSKPEAELIGGNMAGDNPRTLAAEFKFSRQLNQNVKRPVYHASLSLPHRERLDDSRWNALAADYLKQMGFTDNQYVLVRHSDREHDHVHVVASRIRLDGSCVHDGWDYRRSETVLRRLEQDYNLEAVKPSWETERRGKTSGQMRWQEDRENKAGLPPTPSVKQQIQNIADRVIQQCATPEQFLEKMKSAGVNVQTHTRRDGSIRGISYQYELPLVATVATSGTKLGTGYTWNGILGRIQELDQQRLQSGGGSEGTPPTQAGQETPPPQEQSAQLPPQLGTVPDSSRLTRSRQALAEALKRIKPGQSQPSNNPKDYILNSIQIDRARYKSACESDVKTAILGLVAGHDSGRIEKDISSNSELVKHWEASEKSPTVAITKTHQYINQLCSEAETHPLYHQELYKKYASSIRAKDGNLPREELDQKVALVALKSHPESAVSSMLKHSLAAKLQGDEYVQKTLAIAQGQSQSQQRQKTHAHEPKVFDIEY